MTNIKPRPPSTGAASSSSFLSPPGRPTPTTSTTATHSSTATILFDATSSVVSGATDETLSLAHLDPIPTYEESLSAPRPGPLQILGATWGGVQVTAELQRLAAGQDELVLDMKTLWTILTPDPAPGKLKVLTVVYRFDDTPGSSGGGGEKREERGEEENDLNEIRLLCVSEEVQPSKVVISRRASQGFLSCGEDDGAARAKRPLHGRLGRAWRAGPQGEVDILAVLYGPKRIETPSVLAVLANHFEGRWGQIRMTNSFFGTDPWPYKRKTWTVYFRFVGSKIVQVVTGWEDGALEIPWRKDV
ncbi:hypothetical protein VTJ04DRAFT_10565 [Mycothermus thermophilus]|uniref:uncharacterized protein n=1 Tax=Humicola insolens TaxID=85995 RepID=UPI0037447E42